MPDHSSNRTTIWMAKELQAEMDEHVDWRYESRSQYIREAIQFRLTLEDALERRGLELPEDDEEREAMIDDIATAGVATFATENGDD